MLAPALVLIITMVIQYGCLRYIKMKIGLTVLMGSLAWTKLGCQPGRSDGEALGHGRSPACCDVEGLQCAQRDRKGVWPLQVSAKGSFCVGATA